MESLDSTIETYLAFLPILDFASTAKKEATGHYKNIYWPQGIID